MLFPRAWQFPPRQRSVFSSRHLLCHNTAAFRFFQIAIISGISFRNISKTCVRFNRRDSAKWEKHTKIQCPEINHEYSDATAVLTWWCKTERTVFGFAKLQQWSHRWGIFSKKYLGWPPGARAKIQVYKFILSYKVGVNFFLILKLWLFRMAASKPTWLQQFQSLDYLKLRSLERLSL